MVPSCLHSPHAAHGELSVQAHHRYLKRHRMISSAGRMSTVVPQIGKILCGRKSPKASGASSRVCSSSWLHAVQEDLMSGIPVQVQMYGPLGGLSRLLLRFSFCSGPPTCYIRGRDRVQTLKFALSVLQQCNKLFGFSYPRNDIKPQMG